MGNGTRAERRAVRFACTTLLLLLVACSAGAKNPVKLVPVKPYSRIYVGADGAQMRRDYFLTTHFDIADRASRESLRSQVYAHRNTTDLSAFKIFGIYVYRRTEALERSLETWGELSESDCKQWVVAGAVWHDGKLARFDLVADWDTVYDMEDDGPIPPNLRNDFDY